jgi:hypothetical protein
MRPPDPKIKAFVQRTLGCSCPEEVFDRIEIDFGAGEISHRIRIGGRLLVYILDASRTGDIAGAVASALQHGVHERDRDHFNRLRLAVVTSSPAQIADAAQAAFASSPARDAKTHLHLLKTGDVGFT